MNISKFEGTLTPKQRVMNTFRFEKADRVPVNYFAEAAIHRRLSAALGLDPADRDAMYDALGVDFRGAMPDYTGPLLFKEIEGLSVNPVYGHYTKWVPNEKGGYNDYCNFPLQDADPEVIAKYSVASPDDFDYDNAVARAKKYKNYAISIGEPGFGDIINSTGRVMGMEDALVNIATEDEATLRYIDRRLDMQIGILERIAAKAPGAADYVWMGEDLGTQIAPMISLEMYRKVLRPRHQRFVDFAKAHNLPVKIHTCGCSSWAYEDFIEMGITAVDTLQPEAVNMSPEYLKQHFGGRLAFHGYISTAGALTYGTADEVTATVKQTLELLMPTHGYMLAPSHQIQDNTPVENVIAMYNAAHKFGRYE